MQSLKVKQDQSQTRKQKLELLRSRSLLRMTTVRGKFGESAGLIVQHTLSDESVTNDQWILYCGATCHMCNNKHLQ